MIAADAGSTGVGGRSSGAPAALDGGGSDSAGGAAGAWYAAGTISRGAGVVNGAPVDGCGDAANRRGADLHPLSHIATVSSAKTSHHLVAVQH